MTAAQPSVIASCPWLRLYARGGRSARNADCSAALRGSTFHSGPVWFTAWA